MKQNMKDNIIWIIFAGMGALFLVIGIFISANTLNYKNAIDTTGTITSISTSHDSNGDSKHEVYVSYMANGRFYESRLNSYASNFYQGKQLDIYYDKYDPSKIGVKSLDLLCLIFPGIGLIFFIIGSSALVLKRKKNSLEKRLKSMGNAVYAKYTETIINTSYTVNGKSPYNIICEWINPADNQKYIFKSKNIWFNPENTLMERGIVQIPVYIDPNNVKKYYVDVDFILSGVNDLS